MQILKKEEWKRNLRIRMEKIGSEYGKKCERHVKSQIAKFQVEI